MTPFILFVGGLLIGTYDAVIGSGGLLTVSLFSIAGLPMLPAIGTMRLITLLQEAVSAVAFWRKGLLHPRVALFYAIFAAIGGWIGAVIVVGTHPETLSLFVGILMIVLLIAIPKLNLEDRQEMISPIDQLLSWYRTYIRRRHPRLNILWNKKTLGLVLACFALGVYGGFYGAGVGTLALFPFAIIGGLGLLRSAANARVIGFAMSLTASLVFINEQAILWDIFWPFAAGTAIGSWIGVEGATRLPLRWLRLALACIVAIAAVRLLFFT